MQVYSIPEELKEKLPDVTRYGWKEYEQHVRTFIDVLAAVLKRGRPHDELVGKVARFGVADGFAEYMVASTQPPQLVHIPMGDAYEFQYIERLTMDDIRQNIARQERLADIFKVNDE